MTQIINEHAPPMDMPPNKKPKVEGPPHLNLTPRVAAQNKKTAFEPPPQFGVWSSALGMCSLAPPSPEDLNSKEISAVQQLIKGYRESAGFLLRAAEQLENVLQKATNS